METNMTPLKCDKELLKIANILFGGKTASFLSDRDFANRKRKNIRHEQGAYGDTNWYEIEIPEGWNLQSYFQALKQHRNNYINDRFYIENGKIIEETYFSIGD